MGAVDYLKYLPRNQVYSFIVVTHLMEAWLGNQGKCTKLTQDFAWKLSIIQIAQIKRNFQVLYCGQENAIRQKQYIAFPFNNRHGRSDYSLLIRIEVGEDKLLYLRRS